MSSDSMVPAADNVDSFDYDALLAKKGSSQSALSPNLADLIY